MRKLEIKRESWPIRGSFTISRGSRTSAEVITVTLAEGQHLGRGECVPYARYGESLAGVKDSIEGLRSEIEAGMDRVSLQTVLPAGAARNAIDCALWDLEARQTNSRVWDLLKMNLPLKSLTTAYTLSLDSAEKMRRAAELNAGRPLLKIKLGSPGDLERMEAVRQGAPKSKLILDANEAWTARDYLDLIPRLTELGVAMIEQPFPAGADSVLGDFERPIPICADESCHDTATLESLLGKYDMINIKLDKTGGLTEALKLKAAAESVGLSIMVGCMVSTSLAMAPAFLLAQGAEIVDLDGPLLLEDDRSPGLEYQSSKILQPSAQLWG